MPLQRCIRLLHFLFCIFKPVFEHWTGGEATPTNRMERQCILLIHHILLSCFSLKSSVLHPLLCRDNWRGLRVVVVVYLPNESLRRRLSRRLSSCPMRARVPYIVAGFAADARGQAWHEGWHTESSSSSKSSQFCNWSFFWLVTTTWVKLTAPQHSGYTRIFITQVKKCGSSSSKSPTLHGTNRRQNKADKETGERSEEVKGILFREGTHSILILLFFCEKRHILRVFPEDKEDWTQEME